LMLCLKTSETDVAGHGRQASSSDGLIVAARIQRLSVWCRRSAFPQVCGW
jgi:hypothetical protein